MRKKRDKLSVAMREDVMRFFTEHHEALATAKKEMAAEENKGTDEAAKQAKVPIGGALDRAVTEYEAHLADDYTFIDTYGAVINKTDYLQHLRSGHAIFDDLTRSRHNVRIYGENAVMTCLATVKGEMGGKDITGRYIETHTLRRQGASWQLLASQSTLAQPMRVLFPIRAEEFRLTR